MAQKSHPGKDKGDTHLEILFGYLRPEDVTANRQGTLSDWQQQTIARHGAWTDLAWGLGLFGITGLIITGVVIAAGVYPLAIVGIGITAFGIGATVYARRKRLALQADRDANRVEMARGKMKLTESWRYLRWHHVWIGDHSFTILRWKYNELRRYMQHEDQPDMEFEAFYLPQSNHILSLARVSPSAETYFQTDTD